MPPAAPMPPGPKPPTAAERALIVVFGLVLVWTLVPALVARALAPLLPGVRKAGGKVLLLCLGWLGATIVLAAGLAPSTGSTRWLLAGSVFVLVNLVGHSAIDKSVEQQLTPGTPLPWIGILGLLR